MTVSIIIPIYNGEKYLAECIESCLEQTYDDFEIIIVNDGSTDNSEKIADSYLGDGRVKIIHKDNGGTASALNTGIKHMSGTWVKWLSADDKFHSKHALKDMMYIISTTPNMHRYIFYSNYVIIDEKSNMIEPFDEPDRTHLGTDLRNVELMHAFYGNGSSSVIHKSVFEECGLFLEGLSHNEDLEFWIRVCIKFRHTLYLIPIRTIEYRVHRESLTSTKDVNENLKLVNSFRDEYRQYLTKQQKDHLKKLQDTIPLRRRLIPVGMRKKMLNMYGRVR